MLIFYSVVLGKSCCVICDRGAPRPRWWRIDFGVLGSPLMKTIIIVWIQLPPVKVEPANITITKTDCLYSILVRRRSTEWKVHSRCH